LYAASIANNISTVLSDLRVDLQWYEAVPAVMFFCQNERPSARYLGEIVNICMEAFRVGSEDITPLEFILHSFLTKNIVKVRLFLDRFMFKRMKLDSLTFVSFTIGPNIQRALSKCQITFEVRDGRSKLLVQGSKWSSFVGFTST
jgi:hypothetical protein